MKGSGFQIADAPNRTGWIIVITAVLLIPFIYAAIILTAKWGPYDNLAKLPVAVVNKDTGGTSNGQPINVGNDLVEELKGSNTLGWEFVDEKTAKQGLDDLKYYMVVEIPEDFSKNVTTVLDEKPIKPELKYVQNEGLHFMAAQVTKSATERIRESLANKVTETYTRSLLSQLGEIGSGFSDGADGSQKINDGAVQLKEGTGQILSSLQEKAPDINRLADGANELKAGTNTLYSSLASKQSDIAKLADGANQVNVGTNTLLKSLQEKSGDISKLAKGAGDIQSGAQQVNKGAQDLQKGAGNLEAGAKQVLDGLTSAQSGSQTLAAGLAEKLVPGSKEVAAGAATVNTYITQLAPGAQSLASGIKALGAKLDQLAPGTSQTPEFQQLVGGSTQIAQGLQGLAASTPNLAAGAKNIADGLETQITPGTVQLEKGLTQLVAGQKAIHAGAQALATGAGTLAGGTNTLAAGAGTLASGNKAVDTGWKIITQGVTTLADGTKQVAVGNASVKSGWGELTNGAGKINSGMTQISSGTQTVQTGWGTLTNGVSQVNDGIGQIEAGSKELAAGLAGGADKVGGIRISDENIAMFAAPVELNAEVINKYPAYRYANAPYTLSLALFVGALVISLLFNLQKPVVPEGGSAFRWYLNKLGYMALLGVAQAVIASLFASFYLKSTFANGISLILFSIFVSLVFIAIISLLVVAAGNIGRFIAVAFLVLQLSTTGAALPVQMLPSGLEKLSSFLPITHSINGFKSVVTLSNYDFLWTSVGRLAIFFIIAIGFTLVAVWMKSNNKSVQDEVAV